MLAVFGRGHHPGASTLTGVAAQPGGGPQSVQLGTPFVTAGPRVSVAGYDLDEHLKLRGPALPSARLFVRQDGTTLRAHHVHAAWGTARRRADLPGAHLHDLRHAGLTLAAQSGATLAEVMRRTGHSSSRAAMIYQHAAERRDAEAAERLGRLAAGTNVNRSGAQRARRER